jgi:phosphoribosylamine--glycine ligase
VTSVLIVGSGAREHALAWKLSRSPMVDRLLVAPGNPGTALVAENVPVEASDIDRLCRMVRHRDIDLTVIGPEAPLALGLADRLRSEGRSVFGPDRQAARIEWSKAFAKEVMSRAGVPTARYALFDELESALAYIDQNPGPLVVKADGLASGKGVTVCPTSEEAREAARAALETRVFGEAGDSLLIEEALSGVEVSLLAFVDGERAQALPIAQDHKRLLDGDLGPNTGGMGAYAPVPFLDKLDREALMDLTVRPIVSTLCEMGMPFRGLLFAGLMLTADGPRVLEYNCRFGDPETQAILPLMREDLLPWLLAAAEGTLPASAPHCTGHAVAVVYAAPGYPVAPRSGSRVFGLDERAPGTLVFQAGTVLDPAGEIRTSGGRVLSVVGTADTLEGARSRAYSSQVCFVDMQYRTDIAGHAAGTGSTALWRGLPDGSDNRAGAPLDRRPGPTWCVPGPVGAGSCRARNAEKPDPPRIAVLVSGEGSNLQALLDAQTAGTLGAEIVLVVSHRVGARALSRAQAAGIPAYALPLTDRKNKPARRLHEEQVLGLLKSYEVDLAVLAGWMLILSPEFLDRCPFPVLNVHPALLPFKDEQEVPALRGAHAVRDAINLHLERTGVSVHLVTAEVDAGPVVAREEVSISPGDTEDSLYQRIKAVEHRLLPRAVQSVLSQTEVGGVHA